jgi:hypothetical protein
MPKPSPAPTGRKTSAQGKAPRAAALGPRPTKNPSPERATQSANSTGLPPGWVKTTHGEIRRKLLERCDVHTLLRLPTGIWYSPGVQANVLFFDKKKAAKTPWTKELWVYDLRTNKNFTLRQNPIADPDLTDFIECYQPGKPIGKRKESERFKRFSYADLMARDKANLDIFWLKDDSLADTDNLPHPSILFRQILEDLAEAMQEFQSAEDILLEDTDPETPEPAPPVKPKKSATKSVAKSTASKKTSAKQAPMHKPPAKKLP